MADLEMSFDEVSRTMWDGFLRLSRASRTSSALEDEASIRDVMARYLYFYDAKSLDGILSVHHPDCVLINPRGTYVGHKSIRANYEYLTEWLQLTLHSASNHLIRFEENQAGAWMAVWVQVYATTLTGESFCSVGMILDRLVKLEGEWLIRESRVSEHFVHTLALLKLQGPAGTPLPDGPRTSADFDVG